MGGQDLIPASVCLFKGKDREMKGNEEGEDREMRGKGEGNDRDRRRDGKGTERQRRGTGEGRRRESTCIVAGEAARGARGKAARADVAVRARA